MTNLLEQAINSNDADHAARIIQKPPSETMPEDVRQAFCDAVRIFDRWRFASRAFGSLGQPPHGPQSRTHDRSLLRDRRAIEVPKLTKHQQAEAWDGSRRGRPWSRLRGATTSRM